MFPSETDFTICFAHVAYQLQQRFALRKLPIRNFGVTSCDELDAGIGEADVLVISGLWRNELAARAPKLRFISIRWCRHRSVRPCRAQRAGHPPRQRAGRQRQRRFRTRDVAHSGASPAAA
jgi:hypothetical protein